MLELDAWSTIFNQTEKPHKTRRSIIQCVLMWNNNNRLGLLTNKDLNAELSKLQMRLQYYRHARFLWEPCQSHPTSQSRADGRLRSVYTFVRSYSFVQRCVAEDYVYNVSRFIQYHSTSRAIVRRSCIRASVSSYAKYWVRQGHNMYGP